jgi:hypothetical protein
MRRFAYRVRTFGLSPSSTGVSMGKAIYGFHGGPDVRVEAELRRLRTRVRELELELSVVRAREEERLAAAELDLTLLDSEDAAALV